VARVPTQVRKMAPKVEPVAKVSGQR